MKYILSGVLVGIILNFYSFSPISGIEIYPAWSNSIKKINQLQSNSQKKSGKYIVTYNNTIYLLNKDGSLFNATIIDDFLFAVSGNGKNYIKYQKVGKEIEYYNIKGERFWKIKSREYPYISYNSKIILLLNGDHSKVRVIDNNGKEIGIKEISGRFCTVMSFSKRNDYCSTGFLDGSFYFLNQSGKVIYKGESPNNLMIKSIAISSNGNFGAIHYGNNKKDYLGIIDIIEKEINRIELKNVHVVKNDLHISDNGNISFIDMNKLLTYRSNGKLEYEIKVPEKRKGFSKINYKDGLYFTSYTMSNGESKFIINKEDGTVILSKEFPMESFLNNQVVGNSILLRGSDSLYCYSIHNLSVQ